MKYVRKAKNYLHYRPPLWWPLEALDKPKRKPKEELSEFEKDRKREAQESALAQYAVPRSIPQSDTTTTPLYRQARLQGHMRSIPVASPRPILASQIPHRVSTPPRWSPPAKPFMPLKERLK